jgi:hypothetical protein
MIQRMRVLSVLLLGGIAGCSSGAQSVLAPATPQTIVAAPTPASAAPATTAKFTITVPAASTGSSRQRSPAYVSTATLSVVITLTTVNGSAYTGSPSSTASNLTPSNPNCTGSPLTCTVSAPAAAGTDTFIVTTYNQQQTSTSPATPIGNLLSEATLSVAVIANQANVASTPLVLDGAPSTIVISGLPSATAGTAYVSAQPFSVNVKDASGNTIVGTYLHPITLRDSDTSGATTIATSGSDNPPAGTLLSSSDTATLNYTGAALSSATISASATGATVASATFAPSSAALILSALSVTSGLIGTTATTTVTGSGFSNATTVGVSGSGVTVQTTYVSPTALTATFFVDPEAATGARTVSVTSGAATATLPSAFTISNSGVTVVTLATDTVPGSPVGSGSGTLGDLRYAINTAPAGNTIVFDTTAMGGSTITLSGPLPPIESNLSIDGGYYSRVTLDGAGLHRIFFIDKGSVAIKNLTLQNALAQGGNGGNNNADSVSGGAGGGGLGAGACVFVNQSTAAVTIANAYLLNCAAAGGNGGNATGATGYLGGGGGGLNANGASQSTDGGYGGGGGGGVLGAGLPATSAGGGAGGAGGVGGGGGGGGGCSAPIYGAGGIAYGSNVAGSTAISTAPGNGGFGGGGGGAANCSNYYVGGNGGFGGGGGGGQSGGNGGNGGVGGGGAGGSSGGSGNQGTGGLGGAVVGAVSGGMGGLSGPSVQCGSDGSAGGGGGGAAAGPAIFVNAGSLTVSNSGAGNATATPGSGGAGGAAPSTNPGSSGSPGTANPTPVFNYAGSVNGSGTTGPVSSALSATTPTAKFRRP